MENLTIDVSWLTNENQKAFIHMLRSLPEKEKEVADQEKHIEYLIEKGRSAELQEKHVQKLINELNLLRKNPDCFELKMWSSLHLNPGDKLKANCFRGYHYEINEIVDNRDNLGEFRDEQYKIGSFYLLHVWKISNV